MAKIHFLHGPQGDRDSVRSLRPDVFLFLGFCLMMLMRWQLAYPGQALPVIGKFLPHIFGPGSMPDGKMTPDFYNSLGAMHGTIMIFLGVVPLAFAAFGNFVVPLQIGAPDMTFPKVNAASFWAFWVGAVIMLISFFVPGGAAKSGWTSYTPLAGIADSGPGHNPVFNGQTLWLIGFIFLITSSLLGAVNFITTIIQLRAKGLTWMRLPFFVWAQFVTAFLLLLAFPPLEAAIVMQLMDRLAHTSFFLPTGMVVNGVPMSISGGGSPLLWQHLFWFLGHPEVYVLILTSVRHRGGNSGKQLAQAALGIQIVGLFRVGNRISLLHRLGASHVAYRHGHGGQRIFSNDDAADLHSIGDYPKRVLHFTLGRLDSVQCADAFHHRVSADVRNRRSYRHPAGI